MGTYQEGHEVEEQFKTTFPSGTGKLGFEMWNDLALLHENWKNYRSLFGTSSERVELLNWAASTFFGLLDGVLLHDVVLGIARLTDPPRSVGHTNACLSSLICELQPFVAPPVLAQWKIQLGDLQKYCEPLRELRNRSLAHSDLATALHYHPDPLPGISRAYIDGALERLRGLLGSIEKHFRGSYTSHQYVISANDGEALISALEAAREHEGCERR